MTVWKNTERAIILLKVFYAIIFVTIINIIGEFLYLNYLKTNFKNIDLESFSNIEIFQSVIGIIFLIVYVLTIVYFLKWFRRAYGNLHRVDFLRVEHQEKMALWGWIIPIICLWRPLGIMKEIDFKTQMAVKKLNPSFEVKNNKILIHSWWALYIISIFFGRYFLKSMFNENQTIEGLIEFTQISIMSDILQIIEAILVIFIVRNISKNEEKLAIEVQSKDGVIEEVK